jgi:hypothetical protein
MSRFLLLASGLAIGLCCASGTLTGQTTSNAQGAQPNEKLTSDAAVAAIRSKQEDFGASYQLIRELRSNNDMQDAAQASLREMPSHGGTLYGDGIFIDLLTSGGFLILEVDSTSGNAISLHLVSTGPNGKPVVDSRRVVGKVNATLARQLMDDTTEVVDLLFAVPINKQLLESKFYDGRFPEFEGNEEDEYSNLFAVPRGIRRTKGDEGEVSELSGLLGCIHFWWVRYAISTPVFPIAPFHSLGSSAEKYESVIGEFARSHNERSDFIHEPVLAEEQLRARIATFTQLNEFMGQKMAPERYLAANRSISAMPLVLGSAGPAQEVSYYVMTASGVVVAWRLSSTGHLVVARIGIAGD